MSGSSPGTNDREREREAAEITVLGIDTAFDAFGHDFSCVMLAPENKVVRSTRELVSVLAEMPKPMAILCSAVADAGVVGAWTAHDPRSLSQFAVPYSATMDFRWPLDRQILVTSDVLNYGSKPLAVTYGGYVHWQKCYDFIGLSTVWTETDEDKAGVAPIVKLNYFF